MISKYYIGRLDQVVSDHGSLKIVTGRCSGKSTGVALQTLGKLMDTEHPYIVLCDKHIYNIARGLILKLGLKFFEFNKDLTIEYKPWIEGS